MRRQVKSAEQLDRIMRSPSEELRKAEVRYKKAFDLRMRKQKNRTCINDYVFKWNLPFKVGSVTDATCVNIGEPKQRECR